MSALRSLSKRPEPYLAVLLLVAVAIAVDSTRPAHAQVTASLYVHAVHAYQRFGRPVANRYIRCPTSPTCSEYTIQAVQKCGILRGIVMTVRRLASCQRSVKMGTFDPVADLHRMPSFDYGPNGA